MHETLAGVAKRALCASPSAARRGDRSDEGGRKLLYRNDIMGSTSVLIPSEPSTA